MLDNDSASLPSYGGEEEKGRTITIPSKTKDEKDEESALLVDDEKIKEEEKWQSEKIQMEKGGSRERIVKEEEESLTFKRNQDTKLVEETKEDGEDEDEVSACSQDEETPLQEVNVERQTIPDVTLLCTKGEYLAALFFVSLMLVVFGFITYFLPGPGDSVWFAVFCFFLAFYFAILFIAALFGYSVIKEFRYNSFTS